MHRKISRIAKKTIIFKSFTAEKKTKSGPKKF